jgi:hypothetical protein
MSHRSATHSRLRMAGFVSLSMAWVWASVVATAEPVADPAAALLSRYAALRGRLAQSPFPQHLYVESVEGPDASQGEVYAVVDYPIGTVRNALANPAQWCDVLILHLNVKYCRPLSRGERTVLSVAIGRKHDQQLSDASRVEFLYDVATSRPDYLGVELHARNGPVGTGHYRIALEGVGLENDRAFVHLRYSYTYGSVGRLAMQMYLATTGSDKVGFTVIGDPNSPRPEFIGGVRGAIERNTMRYYLAIDAYLGALAAPAPERFERSLERWFDATELYPRQLHEVDRDDYLAMKRREYRRQQTIQ